MSATDTQVRYWRSRDGHVIHRGDCSRRGAVVRWNFTDNLNDHEVETTVLSLPWLRGCAYCFPEVTE